MLPPLLMIGVAFASVGAAWMGDNQLVSPAGTEPLSTSHCIACR